MQTVPDLPIDPPEPKPDDFYDRVDMQTDRSEEERLCLRVDAAKARECAGTAVGRESATVMTLLSSCVTMVRAAIADACNGLLDARVKVKAEYTCTFGDNFLGGNLPRVSILAELAGEPGTFRKTIYRDPRSPEFLDRFDAECADLASEIGRRARFAAFEREQERRARIQDAERFDGLS